MCICILNKKKGKVLTDEQIYNSWENNDMGGGLLWNENKKLHSFKTYDYKEFLDKYKELRSRESVGNVVLHFRIATSGIKGIHNLHPFLVNDNLGFVHNGVLSGLGNTTYSDTYEFNEMLKTLKHDFTSCKVTKDFISSYIGSSKLVFLNNHGTYTIINDKYGHWSDGNWFSNDSYKQVNTYAYYGNTRVSKIDNKFDYLDDFVYEYKDYGVGKKVNKETTSVIKSGLDWDVYQEICYELGYDPTEIGTETEIEWLMSMNRCETIYDLYEVLFYDGGFEYDWEEELSVKDYGVKQENEFLN